MAQEAHSFLALEMIVFCFDSVETSDPGDAFST